MTVEVELNERTLIRLKQKAKERRLSIEMVLQDIVERFFEIEETDDSILGMFSQEPDLMDGVIAGAMDARENDPYRRIQSVGYDLRLDNWR
jgi:hypothetical protein